jgi:hypothetical protein
VEKIISTYDLICQITGDQSCCISFSVGIDATVLDRSFGVNQASRAIASGVTTHVMLDMSGLSSDQVQAMQKDCIDGRKGVMAAGVKGATVLFKTSHLQLLHILCYLVFHIQMMTPMIMQKELLNIVIRLPRSVLVSCSFKFSTGGVSCEFEFNKVYILIYLDGKSSTISLQGANHNVKILCYQLIGGSSVATLGHYCFAPYMLVIAGVAEEVISVEDYASDALVLRLAIN